MSRSDDYAKRRAAVVPRGVAQFNLATAVSGRAAILVDADGRELIDFVGGIGVMTIGHNPPAVVRAIREQAERLLRRCIHIATYDGYLTLCEKLARLLPHGERTKLMLVNTGTEGVENAVKIARQATGPSALRALSTQHATEYHLRTPS